jgi:CheY-like chemotaxis protein
MRAVILVVDDDPGVRLVMGIWLEDADLEHEEASSGETALDLCAQHTYEVIVLDQRMPPGMDGIEVARALRERGDTTPIVMHSAYLDPNVEAAADQLGIPTVQKGDDERLVELIHAARGSN